MYRMPVITTRTNHSLLEFCMIFGRLITKHKDHRSHALSFRVVLLSVFSIHNLQTNMVSPQEVPTTATTTEVPNADGTITRTVVNQYNDGTRRTIQEILPPEAGKAPPMVQALPANPSPPSSFYDIERQQPTTASLVTPDAQQPSTSVSSSRTKKAPSVPFNFLTRIAIVFVVLGTTFGIAAGVYTHLSQTRANFDFEEDGRNGLLAGAAAIFLFTLATPFMFFSSKLYQAKRASKGLSTFVMAAWIIYGFALSYAGGLLFLAMEVPDYPVRPTWVYVAVVFNLVPFLLMMIHAEAARMR